MVESLFITLSKLNTGQTSKLAYAIFTFVSMVTTIDAM